MKFRFRKAKKILPGVRINVSKSGVSATVGPKHANIGISKTGTRVNAGVPKTGISGQQKLSGCGTLIGLAALVGLITFILRMFL